MSDKKTFGAATAERAKAFAAAAAVRLRKFWTPELGKKTAICFFMLFLLWCECVAFFFSKVEVRSILRPFVKGMAVYLAVFGLSIIPGGKIAKALLSFWLVLMGVVAAVGVFLYLRFALDMNCDCFFVLAASSATEVREFLERFLTWKLLAGLLAATAACGGMVALVWHTQFRRSFLNTAVGVLLTVPFLMECVYYTRIFRDTGAIYSQCNLSRTVVGSFTYRRKLSRLLRLEKHPQLPSGIRSLAGTRAMVGVLAIGESANCNHWGVYGYPRDTTPEIAKRLGDCVLFDDAVAAAAWTGGAIYRMLTDATVRSPRVNYTLIDVLKAAGWRVVLISDHNRWGRKDGPIGIITAHCDRRIYMYDILKYPFDGDMLPELEKELNGFSGGRLLVILHLIGSHNIFSARYPKGFSRFDGVRDECNSFMSAEQARELNEYDNTIAYTDRVLGGILELLEKQSVPAFMLYCSDHSELGVWSGYRFARSAAAVIPDIYEIPFVFWANAEYRREFPRLFADAARNRSAPLQADRLIWSVLSAARVTFDRFPLDKDVFSGAEYRPPERRMMIKYRMPYRPSAAKEKLRKRRRGERPVEVK